jgi:hypothetical protein
MNPLRKLDGEATGGPWNVSATDQSRVRCSDNFVLLETCGPALAPSADARLIVTLRNALPEIAELYEAAERMSKATLPELCCLSDPRCRACPRCDVTTALAALKEKLR